MKQIRKQISALGALLSTAAIALSMLGSVAHVVPPVWEWQDITPTGWNDLDDYSGSMIWGTIMTSTVYGGDTWFGGVDASGKGALYRYNHLNNTVSNATPGGMDSNYNYIRSLFEYGGKLYLGTNNPDSGAELWSLNGSTWTQDTSIDSEGINGIYSMVEFNGNLCFSGYKSPNVTVYCKVSGTWTNTNVAAGGAIYDTGNAAPLVSLGSKMYLAAQTDESFEGIFVYQGSSWTQVQTPFTDEEETNEETHWSVLDMVRSSSTTLAAMIHDGSGVMQIQSYNGSTWSQLGQNNFGHPDDGSYSTGALTVKGSHVIAGTGEYNNSAEVYEWDGSNWTLRNSDYFGADYTDGNTAPQTITTLTSDGTAVFASTAAIGEGYYFPQLWRTPVFVGGDEEGEEDDSPAPNVDDDTTSDAVEAAAPNGGDANNDGIPDKNQANVTSFVNPVTNKYAVLQSDCTGNSSASVANAGGLSVKDGAFSYPAGLMNFTLNCSTPGMTANVAMYYYGDYNAATVVARKYNNVKKEYATISGATVSNVTIGGQRAVKITYAIKDGGELDQDGTANGTIVDPAGPGVNSVSAPNTGAGGTASKFWLLNL